MYEQQNFQTKCLQHLSSYTWPWQSLQPRQFINLFPSGKMAAIMQTIFSDIFWWMKSFIFLSKFHWSLVPKGLIDNIPALFQILVWHWPVNKPLSVQWWLVSWCIYLSLGLNNLSWSGKYLNFQTFSSFHFDTHPLSYTYLLHRFLAIIRPSQVYHGNPYTDKTASS